MPVAASGAADSQADASWADGQSAGAHSEDAQVDDRLRADWAGPDDHLHRADWAGSVEHPRRDGPDGCRPPDVLAGPACCQAVSACSPPASTSALKGALPVCSAAPAAVAGLDDGRLGRTPPVGRLGRDEVAGRLGLGRARGADLTLRPPLAPPRPLMPPPTRPLACASLEPSPNRRIGSGVRQTTAKVSSSKTRKRLISAALRYSCPWLRPASRHRLGLRWRPWP